MRIENKVNRRSALKGIAVGLAGLIGSDSNADVFTLPDGRKIAVDGDDYVREHLEGIYPEKFEEIPMPPEDYEEIPLPPREFDEIPGRREPPKELSRGPWREVSYIRDKAIVNGLLIETNGEIPVYRNDGERHRSSPISYVSQGNMFNNYKLSAGTTPNGEISLDFLRGNKFGGIETKFGPLKITTNNYSFVILDDRTKFGQTPHVPLARTAGLFNIKSGGRMELDYSDRDFGIVTVARNADFKNISTPALQIDSYKPNGDYLETNFIDYYGRSFLAIPGRINFNGNSFQIYIFSDGERKNLYLPTKEFAKLWNKHGFWHSNNFWNQIRLSNACCRDLEKSIKWKYRRHSF